MTQSQLLEIAMNAVRSGEGIAMRAFHSTRASTYVRKSTYQIVTSVDLAVNAAIIASLKRATPEIPILSEEGADIGVSDLKNEALAWVLDPIDGTTNFAAHLPLWGISLALVENGEPLIGVLGFPMLDERFHAVSGRGAWLGRKRIRISHHRKLGDCLALLYFGPQTGDADLGLPVVERIARRVRTIRRLGATSVDCACVATGRADFAILNGQILWDVAAGVVIVQEAGGKMVTLEGKPWTYERKDAIIASPALLPQILRTIRS